MSTTLTSNGGKQEISLSEWGPDVSGRERGLAIREIVQPGMAEVVFDCYGIETMSPSFADELFGKLSVQEGRPTNIKAANASADVLSVIRFAVRERMQGDSAAQ